MTAITAEITAEQEADSAGRVSCNPPVASRGRVGRGHGYASDNRHNGKTFFYDDNTREKALCSEHDM